MAYVYPQKILFKHCDPAGIVFYPRYFEMMNDCVEAFFDEILGLPFSTIHREGGVPMAEISTRFRAPSRLGDKLKISLRVTKHGRSSIGLCFHAECDGETRFETKSTLVRTNGAGRPTEWSEKVGEKINACLKDDQNGS